MREILYFCQEILPILNLLCSICILLIIIIAVFISKTVMYQQLIFL
ncbi:hypothetical protein GECvBN5_gp171c [Salmonella phage GEC_vB_N5]|uniref:Uncharacterized protein n=1 Tax=Salmonella phage GEC_vB_N5 TaxID=2777378 RepID=A0A7S9XEE5_9CAUD|nr:hypothetical protein GECvBN5_gp171c [Salmonella phage GEC_vB_N5]